MQVVDHDQRRAALCERAQDVRDLHEQLEAGALGVEGIGRMDARGARLGSLERRERGGGAGGRVLVAQRLTEDLHPGPEGGCTATLPRASAEDGESATLRQTNRLFGEARLSRSGFAGDQHEAAASSGRLGEGRIELHRLVRPADEGPGVDVARARRAERRDRRQRVRHRGPALGVLPYRGVQTAVKKSDLR